MGAPPKDFLKSVKPARGYSPEVEIFEVFLFFGVEEGGGEEGDGGGEFAVGVVGGGLHVVAGGFVVEEEGSGDDFGIFCGLIGGLFGWLFWRG